MNYQNFSAPVPGVPEFGQEMASLNVEQKMLLESLMAKRAQARQGAAPLEAGGHTVLNLAPLGAALGARRDKEELETTRKKQADVTGRYQTELLAQMRRMRQNLSGSEQELPGPTESGAPLTGMTKPNQRGYEEYLSSPFPEVRAAAEAEQKRYQSRADELAKRSTVGSVQAAGDDLGKYQAKPEYKEVNGAVMDLSGEAPPSVAPGMGVTQITSPGGVLANQYPGGKQDTVDKGIKIQMPGQDLVAERIKMLPEDKKEAEGAANLIQTSQQAIAALREGAVAGGGANYKNIAKNLVTGLTGIPFPENTPTAVLAKSLAKATLEDMGGRLGAGVSNADREYMADANGALSTDPHALERILAIRMGGAERLVRTHNDQVETLSTLPNNPYGAEATKKLFQIKPPGLNYSPATPEAAAAFESNMTRRAYNDVLGETKGMKYGGPTAPNENPEERARKRMQELGLPYTPPGGR
jgi:hypothetical protein